MSGVADLLALLPLVLQCVPGCVNGLEVPVVCRSRSSSTGCQRAMANASTTWVSLARPLWGVQTSQVHEQPAARWRRMACASCNGTCV